MGKGLLGERDCAEPIGGECAQQPQVSLNVREVEKLGGTYF